MKRPKVPCTNRIRWCQATTLYVSSEMASKVSQLCLRGHQNVLIPLKGECDQIRKILRPYTKTHPNHFLAGTRNILS